MITKKKSEASRRNGAKSRGPVTPAGKARSAMNSVVHGLASRNHRLVHENEDAYQQNLHDFVEQFQPATNFEFKQVELLAGIHWRLNRATTIETALLDMEVDILGPEIDKAFHAIDDEGLVAIGFKSLADQSSALGSLDRQQTRLSRQYERVWRHLAEIQRARLAQENLTNEPEHEQLPPDQQPADELPPPLAA